MKIPHRHAPHLYGIMQSGLTTAIAATIATYRQTGMGGEFGTEWLLAWTVAWVTMLPIVIFLSPFIQRAVEAVVEPAQTTVQTKETMVAPAAERTQPYPSHFE